LPHSKYLVSREKFELASDDFTLNAAALKQYFKCNDREIKIVRVIV